MAKRTNTDSALTNRNNFWPTPREAVLPLVDHLRLDTIFSKWRYVEPCAGDGALVDALAEQGFLCAGAFDVAPRRADIKARDAALAPVRLIPHLPRVTNPPWAKHLLKPILDNLVGQTVVWLLLPLDMAANIWTNPYMAHVNKLVPLGRVSWLGNGKAGMENSAWFRFDMLPQDFITERKAK